MRPFTESGLPGTYAGSGRTSKLQHWNRRAWQEIAILKTRIEILEKAMKIDTGGDYEYAPEGDPWEPEIIHDYKFSLFCFIIGVLVGMSVTLALTL
jgi:hypothetical protein